MAAVCHLKVFGSISVTEGVSPVPSLVFSQSLISLDLIEDFLELSCRAKDEDKVSPYKGNSILNFQRGPG